MDYSWNYDAAGNRTHNDDVSGVRSYTVNGVNEIDPTNGTFAYDDDGNTTSDGAWTYEYDANNRLKRMHNSTYNLLFKYDYMGRRVKKESTTGGVTATTKFLYNGMELLAELNASGNVTKSFHWGPDMSGAQGGAGGAEGLVYQHDWTTGKGYYPAYDLSGNLVGLLDTVGAWKAWYAYDAFGNLHANSGGDYETENPIRYSTQYTDKESGLVYYGFRFYDPSKGRFLTRDPIGEAGGLNLYRFVGNNPVNAVDRLGLMPTERSQSERHLLKLHEEYGREGWNWAAVTDHGKGQSDIVVSTPTYWIRRVELDSSVTVRSGLSADDLGREIDSAESEGYVREVPYELDFTSHLVDGEIEVKGKIKAQKGQGSEIDDFDGWTRVPNEANSRRGVTAEDVHDGHLTWEESTWWYRNGNGRPVTVDANRIDFSSLSTTDFEGVGDMIHHRFPFPSNQFLTYGTIDVTLLEDRRVAIDSNDYDFEMDPWTERPFRNIATLIGNGVAGSGVAYPIIFDGNPQLAK